jgi:predicted ATPase/transcriptional regulator with XRE-family HTH domain
MPNPYKLSILTELRRASGMTLEQMARSFGMTGTKSRETVGAWERGQSVPRPYHRRRFIDYLGNTLGLHKDPTKFHDVWHVLVEEWEWEPLSEAEWQEHFDGEKQARQTAAVPSVPLLHNLPSPVTTFIGRTREIEQLIQLLRTARLITLTGPGGSGKTRLALQVAAELLDTFPDGVFFVDLAPIKDPGLVISAIANALGVKEVADESLIERVKVYLRSKHLLLLLGNFEQVVTAAPLVTDLLKVAPKLTVLVTSRVTLHVYGEQDFPVLPLPLPEPHAGFTTLTQNAAVTLFTQRAQAATLGFVLTKNNAPAVAEICCRLDGLPLAIELAAARSKQFTPQALLASFPRRLDIAGDGPQDVPPRHQTLRALIGWSYDLLPAGEQLLFRRLAIFVGGCTLKAAETVCSGVETGDWRLEAGDQGGGHHRTALTPSLRDVLDGLQSLVDKHLVQRAAGPDGEPRFSMLETIHEYALEQLLASGEVEEVQRRHAAYYLMLAEAAAPALQGPEQVVWLERLEQEHANLRAALQWAINQGEAETAVQLGAALWPFWDVRGHWSEGRQWLERALALGRTAPALLRAKALSGMAALAHKQNDYRRARALYEESLALYTQVDDKRGIAEALCHLGLMAQTAREHAQAIRLYEESLSRFRELGDRRGIALALSCLTWTMMFVGNYEQARICGEESEALSRGLKDSTLIASVVTALGLVAFHQDDYPQAYTRFEESLALYRQLNEPRGISVSLMSQGFVALFAGNYEQAATLFQESLVLSRDLQEKLTIAYCLSGLAGVAGGLGYPLRAARLGGAAEALRESINIPIPPSERPRYEAMVGTISAHVDRVAWEAAWAEGRAMPLEQAIAYALTVGSPA